MRYCYIDFESASAADLKKVGAQVYAEDPTTEIICLGFVFEEGEPFVLPHCDLQYGKNFQLTRAADQPDFMFVAHNAGFEKAIWREIMVPLYGWPNIPNSRWLDTMAIAMQQGLPGSLDKVSNVLRLATRKWVEGSKITKTLSKSKKGYYDRSPEKLAIVYEYNKIDLGTTRDLRRRLAPMPASERNVWLLDQRINERGIRLDTDYIRNAQRIVQEAAAPRLDEFRKLTGGLNVTQRDKVLAWAVERGAKLPDLKKDTIVKLLGASDDEDDADIRIDDEDTEERMELPEDVRRALDIRRVLGSASIKKLNRMAMVIARDGRAHGTLQYYGAISTGRWSGRLFQPQNFPKGVVKLDGELPRPELLVDAINTGDWRYVEALFGDPIDAVVTGLRHAIIASEGRQLVVGDFAGIELRILLALAGQYDKLDVLAAGKNLYVPMAEQIYKRPIDKHKDVQEYTIGKNTILGAGFQMGWKTFRDRYAHGMPEDEIKEAIRAYREDFAPLVPELWSDLQEASLRTVIDKTPHESHGILYYLDGPYLKARLPSGRDLHYYNPQVVKKAMPWDHLDIRPAWTYNALKGGRWITVDAYGGLETENVVQTIARDILVAAMFKAEAADFPLVFTVHDEPVCDVLESIASPVVLKQIMEDSPDWVKRMQLPIVAETWSGERYRK